jgi:hypothetical protein
VDRPTGAFWPKGENRGGNPQHASDGASRNRFEVKWGGGAHHSGGFMAVRVEREGALVRCWWSTHEWRWRVGDVPLGGVVLGEVEPRPEMGR